MNDQTPGLETAPAAPPISELPTVAPETVAPVADHEVPNAALQAARTEALDHELPAGPEPATEAVPVVEEEAPVQEAEPTAAEYSEKALAAHKDLIDMNSNDPGFVDQLIKVNELFIRAGFKKRDEEQEVEASVAEEPAIISEVATPEPVPEATLAVEPVVEPAPTPEPAQTIAEVAPQASQISSLRLPATETAPTAA